MPRYGGYGSDSQEQYSGGAFDPMILGSHV